ncbi:GntR family transcriptional regulator [Arthrobacter crystallopoietes]|uniref:DNA-binding transcriptional regulator, GntR family n=1 Tax=Crystallibacter crystallopoietes TaxID=37928 RepID=A0A1H1HVX8_9MICC|nr:GntR family transcriptional regulator [Arthrobacter crystallopoietes]SDR29611.1 DNA-binding transcriptional regulator, GntR family [Arthrobacter crystallopoietes]
MANRKQAAAERVGRSFSADRRRGAYERIKQAIVVGEFKPGDSLVESALAEWCEVSRTPIREALTRLEQDGIVVRTDRGLVVRDDSPEDVLDLYETRIVLEASAARVASERRSFHDLLQMHELADRMKTMETGDLEAMAAANDSFHRAIWRASHNRSLVDLLDRLSLHLGRYPATTLSFPGRWGRANEQHTALVEAIESRNGDLAASLATEHFTESRDIRLKLWTRGTPS